MKTTNPKRLPRVKRTLTLPEEVDCRIRTLAASKRIPISYVMEEIIKDYFNFKVAQRSE
jgi:predicted transcriptional regulator